MFNLITNDQEIQTAIEKFQKRNFLHELGRVLQFNLNHSPDKNKWGTLVLYYE